MTRFRLTELAEADLEAILDHIADDTGPERAHAVLTDLVSAFTLLGGHPGIGHERLDLADGELRFWGVHAFLIAYRTETGAVEIVRVLHGARDPEMLRIELDE